MRYIVESDKIYMIENDKMIGVNISFNKIEKVGSEKALPKEYKTYSEDEIKRKFQISEVNSYNFKKEETPKEVGGAKKGKSNSK